MASKQTHLLSDDPATADEFGTHRKIAQLICGEIIGSKEGRSIALVGNWGSGKSTIIELLKEEMSNISSSIHLFIYDAWAHQGDSLRRAFLDDFIASLNGKMPAEELAAATDQVWNRTETTKTTTEPVLRRHTKMLLVSLAFIPLGMKLFEFPAGFQLSDGLTSSRNILAYVFLLAPVVILVLLGIIKSTRWTPAKDFLFGESHKEEGFSVLSFFFEKVQGHVERKHIRSPVDSIRSFRDVFSQIIDGVHRVNNALRIVIVVDNIDRVPPEQAREFWSTMQTFFGDIGGLRKPQSKNYWLIAPFSVEALSFVFRDDGTTGRERDGTEAIPNVRAQAYIDKTFGLTVYVPPQILTNWRRYLLGKLRTSFPEHAENDLLSVRDAFDFAKTGSTITPREMKLFVNALVVLYRQRGEEVSLSTMAIYILRRDKIEGTTIADELLSPREQRLIHEADWRVPIAALHFGANLTDATQLLLRDPIVSALRDDSSENLRALEKRPGFFDVLRRVTVAVIDSPEAAAGAILLQIAATIGRLDGASKPELSGVWSDIRFRLLTMETWTSLQASSAEGASSALMHLHGPENGALCQAIAGSLAGIELPEPEGDFQNAYPAATNWLLTALAVIDSASATQPVKVSFPAGNRLKVELLLQLSEIDAEDNFKKAFDVGIPSDQLSKLMADEIAGGRFLRTPAPLVRLLKEQLQLALQWNVIESACADRLRVADTGAQEAQSLTGLLLAAATIGGYHNALQTLKTLSVQGHLSHLIRQHRKNPSSLATLITATMLANSAFERPAQVGQSQNGDNLYNGLADASEFDAAQVNGMADIIKSIRAESLLFETGAKNPKVARLTAAVIGVLARSSYKFDIDPAVVITHRAYLEATTNFDAMAEFIAALSQPTRMLAALVGDPFEVQRARLYRAALRTAAQEENEAYLSFLREGIRELDTSEWEAALNAGSGAQGEVLELANDLRTLDEKFELSTPAREAALAQIRSAGRGTPIPSDEVRARLANLLQLLPDQLRGLLVRDVVDDMAGLNEAAQIIRIIEIAGDQLDLEEEVDAERIVRRIFGPVVSNPTERSVEWIAVVVGRRLEFFREVPKETKSEFAWRLRATLQKAENLTPALKESLTTIAGLLDLKVVQPSDDTPG